MRFDRPRTTLGLRSCAHQFCFRKKRLVWGSLQRTRSYATHPFRLAIIGSGPAGFYAASKLMREDDSARIDMYERLPIPYGLVRYGVAPDHPEVKNCQETLDKAADLPNFNFIGNISIGHDLSLDILKPHYDAILFAYGASKDRELGIPGEDLMGVYSARDFVAWYNGLPGFSQLNPRLEDGSKAIIIGQGNVAMDVARILLSDVNSLRKTDMPEYALEALSRSRITSVHAIGRRGPAQAAFTIKELREQINLPGTTFAPVDRDLFPDDLKTLGRPRRRIAELLIKSGTSHRPDSKQFSLDFLLSPTKFTSSDSDADRLLGVQLQSTQYANAEVMFESTAAVSVNTESEPINIPTTVAFRSIGYKSEPLPGLESVSVPFHYKRGIIPNQLGRVVPHSENGMHVPQPVPGMFTAGWVKRGPRGVIASTMDDAFETVDSLLQDVKNGSPLLNHEVGGSTKLGWDGVKAEVARRGLRKTSWQDWRRIDATEKALGAKLGKEREKIVDVATMLRILDS